MRRNSRKIVAEPGELKIGYGTCEPGGRPDLVYAYGGGGTRKADGIVLSMAFEQIEVLDGKTLRQLLEERGYDIKTLRFTVRRKPLPEEEDFLQG